MLHLGSALVVFYALHSILAWTGVKRWSSAFFGGDRWYRLAYTCTSLLLFSWVFVAYDRVERLPRSWHPSLLGLSFGWALVLAGAVVAAAAVLRFGGASFLGLTREVPGELVRTGLHGHVRHPIYTGVLLMMAGWILLSPDRATALTILITLVYLPIGILLEEIKLIASHGEAYRRYRAEVPALFPRWNIKVD